MAHKLKLGNKPIPGFQFESQDGESSQKTSQQSDRKAISDIISESYMFTTEGDLNEVPVTGVGELPDKLTPRRKSIGHA